MAWLALAEGRPADAERAIRAARDRGVPSRETGRLEACLAAQHGDSADAERRLIHVLQSSHGPEPEVCRALAALLLKTYRLPTAAAVLERWAREDPRDPRPYVWMTEIDSRRTDGGHEAAISHLREALKRDPTHAGARKKLADALREAKQFDTARSLYDELLTEYPDDLDLRRGRGRTLHSLGKTDVAAADFDAVLQARPDDALALRERAAVDLARGRPVDALDRLDRSLRAEPFDPETHFRRAMALEHLKRPAEAQQARDRAAQLRSDHAELLRIQKDFNADPNNLNLRVAIARWMFEHGQPEQGLKWATTAIQRDPFHAEANRLLAEYHESQGDTGRANFHRLQAATHRGGTGPR